MSTYVCVCVVHGFIVSYLHLVNTITRVLDDRVTKADNHFCGSCGVVQVIYIEATVCLDLANLGDHKLHNSA